MTDLHKDIPTGAERIITKFTICPYAINDKVLMRWFTNVKILQVYVRRHFWGDDKWEYIERWEDKDFV